MICPTVSDIPKAVWAVSEKQLTHAEDARVGMIGYYGEHNIDTQQHFIVVWVGKEEIGVIAPLMCAEAGNISFGPDSAQEYNDCDLERDHDRQYKVSKLKLKDSPIYIGINTGINTDINA